MSYVSKVMLHLVVACYVFACVHHLRQLGLLQEVATGAFITWMVVAKGHLAPKTHAGA